MAGRRPFSVAGKLALVCGAVAAAAAAGAVAASVAGAPAAGVGLAAVAAGAVGVVVAVTVALRRPLRLVAALGDGVNGFRAGDFSLRLVSDRDDELGDLVDVYNAVAETVSRERGEVRQRELLLESVLDSTPAAVLLVGASGHVILASREARRFFASGRRLDGVRLSDIVAACPPSLAGALAEGRDAVITAEIGGSQEAFHVTRRSFELNSRAHLLLTIRRMTAELRRQEVAVWKRAIRTVGHELNNTLAPIRSLVASARTIASGRGDPARLREVHDTIDECATRLQRFVEGYARFARLPAPRMEEVELASFLAAVRQLEPFQLVGTVPAATVVFDPGQVQLVLVNLVKNAREAGSPAAGVELSVRRSADTVVLEVSDRGRGMDEETMARALVPFYTSKPDGAGLGLSLSREIVEAHGGRLALASRAGGGLVVTCSFPVRPSA